VAVTNYVATKPPGPVLMTTRCLHCQRDIERWSGGGNPWTHNGIVACDPEDLAVERHRRRANYKQKRLA
jgi:hypothetical protein